MTDERTDMPPRPFPTCVCWQRSRRDEVLNPIALDVAPEVFRATHHPSLFDWDRSHRPSGVSDSERQYLEDFLDPDCPHAFDVAVGDSGTGKSHVIRWLAQEIRRRSDDRFHSVLIPRSSANLADVLRKILGGFHGEATDRILSELAGHRKMSESEARDRVLDELALALKAASEPVSEELAYVRGNLPDLLQDGAIRKHLCASADGVISRIANHVMGERSTDAPTSLRWESDDLQFPATVIARAGKDAAAMAADLLSSDQTRKEACEVLQAVQSRALASLLRFRPGDLKRAMMEVRKSLLARKRQLVLLLEDLSISEGVDAELVEALLVRTRDSGEELCVLRSIVGLTPDDHHRMRENIRGRVRRTLEFDVQVSEEPEVMQAFAARYLNAARLDGEDLSRWDANRPNEPAPSACQTCPNETPCHRAFGEWHGYGLYPLTPVSLQRLYKRASGDGHREKAFNPRTLLRKVLDKVLEDAEASIARGEFPSASLVGQFKLGSTSSDWELQLKSKMGVQTPRALRLYELYSPRPSDACPDLDPAIAGALGLESPSGSPPGPEDRSKGVVDPRPPPPPPPPLTSGPDEFDSWLRQRAVTDTLVNKWRGLVHEAVCAEIDWDVEGLAWLKSEFKRACIRVEDQTTSTPTVLLELVRTPEVATTLRWLSTPPAERGTETKTLVLVRRQLEEWAAAVRSSLERQCPKFGIEKAVDLTVRTLALGAYLRGTAPRSGGEAQLLDRALAAWEGVDATGGSEAWQNLLRQFGQSAGKGQTRCDRAQALVAHYLGCTKGADAGAMIDPSRVLETIREIRKNPVCPEEIPPPEDWGFLKPVGDFVHAVAEGWKAALAAETEAAQEWEEDVRPRVGDDPLEDVLRCGIAALDVAATVGHGNGKLKKAFVELAGKPLKSCNNTVHTSVHSGDPAARVNSLGSLDRTLMKEIQVSLRALEGYLRQEEEDLSKRAEGSEGKDRKELLEKLAADVKGLSVFFAGIRPKGASRA